MEIKKGTKWTCIEDVIIGYNLRIFNASENYESPSDNHLIDNSGKARYVSSAWYDNFVAIPADKRSTPQVENRGTTSPNIDKESYFMAGNLNLKKKDLQKRLGNIEGMLDKEIVETWNKIFTVDETKHPMLDKMLHKEVESALILEALNPPIEKQSIESDAKEWQKHCEQYESKRGYKLGDTEMIGVRYMNSDYWKAPDDIYGKKEYTEHPPKLNYTQGNRGTHLGNPPLNEKKGVKNDSEKGYKEDSEKLNYELDFEFIEAIAQRMSANKHKYEPYNWQKPVDVEKLKQALFRHVIEVMKGNYEDDLRPLGHLESVSLNSMMLYYQLKNYKNAKIN